MSNCLVTTLKEPVTDTDLLKIGEFRIHFNDNALKRINIGMGVAGVVIKVTSPGYITDSTGTSNLGNTATLALYDNNIYLPPGEYDLIIPNKYRLLKLTMGNVDSPDWANTINPFIDINELEYSPNLQSLEFGIKNLESDVDTTFFSENKRSACTSIIFTANTTEIRPKFKGDIANIKKSLRDIRTAGCVNLYGSINDWLDNAEATFTEIDLRNCPNISGNISVLSNQTSITHLCLSKTAVTGNLNSLSGLTNLTYLLLSDTAITGDTSSLANLTNLTTFTYTNTAITGTWPLT